MIERAPSVALAGNPNTGKTTLFNQLTGSRGRVGNYPGVTVELHVGRLELPDGRRVEVIDVPGAYSLSARSREEEVAIQAVAGLHPLERPDLVVTVVDATQLPRNLYLVLQLLELGQPLVVALNMSDLLEERGEVVDVATLERELGVPVVPIVASRGTGLAELRAAIAGALADPASARPAWGWAATDAALVADIEAVQRALPETWHRNDANRGRALALWALLSIEDGDELVEIPSELRAAVRARHESAARAGRDLDLEIVAGRYRWIDERIGSFVRPARPPRPSLTDRLDRVLLHPAVGFLLFLALMVVVFQALFAWADPAIGWIEGAFGWLGDRTAALLPEGVLADFVVEGLIGGVGSVLVFLPQILLLFLFIGLMEDTGYMARVAYLMDRIMRSVGLHGRAFIPMLSGFACAVPAIMATRTMERRRDRLLTMMVIPLMTCSARLPVYTLLIAALYPPDTGAPFAQGLLMAGMYLFSTLTALAAAGVLGRTVFRGPRVPLILEMPPYRIPHVPTVLRLMRERSLVFVREAGTVILLCTIAMWALLSFPEDPAISAKHEGMREALRIELAADADALAERVAEVDADESGEQLRQSYGARLGHAIEPVLEPLGFDWKIGIGLIGAFAAREVFVSTMGVVYGIGDEADEESASLREKIRAERWPDGRAVFTPLVCFSLMVFFALACQCMSTLAVCKRETQGYAWPTFMFTYMTVLAWLASFVVYQGGKLFGLE